MKTRIAAVLLVVIGSVVAWVVTPKRHAPLQTTSNTSSADAEPDMGRGETPATNSDPGAAPDPVALPAPRRAATKLNPFAPTRKAAPQPAADNTRRPGGAETLLPPAPAAEPVVPTPVARAALGSVGADADADLVWAMAINDPNLASDDRRELIEDLNQDGFPDPKHVTEDDLPLIVSRLLLIEELAPDAMDEVNAAAFAEAYKDLVNMLAKLNPQ
jgi:hypothetical protein